MIRKHLGLVALSVALFACGEKSSAKSDKSAEPEKEEPPFSGPLTAERLMKAKGKVDTFDEWSGAYEKLEKFLGKPTLVKGNKYGWGVMEGDTCVYMYAEKDDRSKYIKGEKGDMVGTYQQPNKVEKSGALFNYAECTAFAGKEVGPKEDPKAVAPPTDGSAVPLQVYIDNAIIGRSKWDKQKVKLSALAFGMSTTTNTTTNEETVTINMVADKTAAKTIMCTLKKGTPKPEMPDDKEPLLAEGTVKISQWVNGAGDQGYSSDLEDCTVTFLGKTGAAASASAAASAGPPKK